MKLGLLIEPFRLGPPEGVVEAIAEAERLGFDSLWTSEAYGTDALTPLAWWGAHTTTLKLGTAIVQMAARTPTATAMAALTLDHLSGGRFILGLGASGPQVIEGWYGQPFSRPLARTREYIQIVRAIIAREKPVEFSGQYYTLPYPGGTGLGKPLKATVHPRRADLPIYLAAEGPKNVALAAEIADGWLPLFYAPRHDGLYRQALAEGFARRGARLPRDDFEIALPLPVVVDDDLERAADAVRPRLALYIGGMGARGHNFHFNVFARMGFEEVALRVQDLYLSGRKSAALAAIPTALVEEAALIGPLQKVRADLEAWKASLVTTLLVSGPIPLLRTMAELVL
jgi:F420-dependent oxidoreductase-like protein